MPQEIEIEYKNIISENEYKQMLAAYPFPKENVEQINHYFETTNQSLGSYGCAIRIREKLNTYTITLKEPHPDGLLETHDRISKETFQEWLNGNIIPQPNTSRQLQKLGIS
ncbi:MAG TPA: CYTH domain-containing protein, partial [Bacillota bacterium]|nr:CYTH domain-containing protein [Bacillota bacterium]